MFEDRAYSPLARLIGQELTQVWFVQDYLQLVFGADLSLQCFVWPTLTSVSLALRFGDSGYRDRLCDLIGAEVTSVAASPADGLVVDFGASRLILAPTLAELSGPEIALMSTLGGDGPWDVWLPGEGVFAHLRP